MDIEFIEEFFGLRLIVDREISGSIPEVGTIYFIEFVVIIKIGSSFRMTLI